MSNEIIIDLNGVAKEYEHIYLKNIEKVNPNRTIVIIPREGEK
jgi:hypothetical protein